MSLAASELQKRDAISKKNKKAQSRIVGPRANRFDQQFLPASLEILETPPSPVRMALLILICVFVALALFWSWIGTTDIFATAVGKIQPTGNVKIVQPLETGRVKSIDVKNGQLVTAGDVVLTQDPGLAKHDLAAVAISLASWRAEAIRRRRSIEILTEITPLDIDAATLETLQSRAAIKWPDNIPPDIREREELVLKISIIQLHSTLVSLAAQKDQKQAEIDRLSATASAETNLIASLQERLDMQEKLAKLKNASSRAQVLDFKATLQTQQAILASEEGQIQEAKASLSVLNSEVIKEKNKYMSEDISYIIVAERNIDELEQRLANEITKIENMTLHAPISGIVQSLNVTTIGQVIASGQELMRIVPAGSKLEISAFLENKDIGFVHEGQDAVIKVESFPFTRYGTLSGKVIHVGRDSIPASDAMRSEGDPTLAPNAQNTFQTSQPTQSLVYPITIIPDQVTINADGIDVPLAAGMAVTAEIRTGTRRILEYIVSPLVEVGNTSLKER